MSEPPLKRVRSGVAASRAALQSALDATDAQATSEAVQVTVECASELRAALEELRVFGRELGELQELRNRVVAQEGTVRARVKQLAAAEHKLLEAELEAAGDLSYLHDNQPLVSSSTLLKPVSLRELVLFAQKISYSTAGPPLTPAGPISLMPLAGTMRLSTLYNPVARLADPTADAAVRLPPQRQQPMVLPQALPQANKPLPPELNLDLDLEQSGSSSDDDSSSSSESSAADEDAAEDANGW